LSKTLLLTGPAGVGKTGLIRRLSEIFKEFNPSGFYTEAITEDGMVKGFAVASLYGDARVFSHMNIKSKYSVGKFRIDMKGFENLLEGVFSKDKKTGLFIVDEIGKMECQSRKFGRLILELLHSEKPVVATIAEKGTGMISEIKKRNDIKLIEITPDNHELVLKELTMEIRDLLLE
jgi:nucleoside-triphosphatase